MTAPEHITELERFVASIARLIKDGECRVCGDDTDYDDPECGRGSRLMGKTVGHSYYDMAGDDAVDTLHSLIDGARALAEFTELQQPACPACKQPFRALDTQLVYEGQLYHWDCTVRADGARVPIIYGEEYDKYYAERTGKGGTE
jgi:hypothetical protein